jgi:hypothetical protein
MNDMNQLGIECFKKEISIGDEITVSTRDFTYYGIVTEIKDDYFVIDEDGYKSYIYYAHVWAYYKE